VLCKTIKAISPETWEAVNKVLIHYAQNEKIEKGREVRIDSVVESNIHEPTDSSLLFDSVKILSRLLSKAKEVYGLPIIFDRTDDRPPEGYLRQVSAQGGS
jgi:IS5 family transposase